MEKHLKWKWNMEISAPTWNDSFDLPAVLIQLLIFKITLNLSSKNMKL